MHVKAPHHSAQIKMSSLSANSNKTESLKGKTLVFVARDLVITSDEDTPVSTWRRLKELGLKSVVVVLRKSSLNARWCSTLKALGVIEEYNVDGLINEREDTRFAERDATAIVAWLEMKNVKVNALTSRDDYGQLVCSYASKLLGVRSNSCESMKTAIFKDATQNAVLQDARSSKHGIPSHVVETEGELITAAEDLRFPMVLKRVSADGAIGCKLVHDLSECRDFFKSLTEDPDDGCGSVLLAEYVEGPKFCVDVIINNGQLVGGALCQGITTAVPYFWQTIKIVPGDVTEHMHNELVTAAYKCCSAVGLDHGVFDVDLIIDKASVPKLVEINPRPGGNHLNEMLEEVYKSDVTLLHYLLACGVDLAGDDLKLVPQKHAAAYCVYLQIDGERGRIQRALGYIFSMANGHGIFIYNTAKMTATEILLEEFETPRPIMMMMATDEISRRGAIESLARFLVDTTYFDNMGEALSRFQ